jgi:hypothetical protein
MSRGGRGRRYDPYLVAVASLTGVTKRYAWRKRVSRDDALVEIAEVVADLPKDRRRDALTEAAQGFFRVDPAYDYGPAALQLLADAGADLDAAAALAAADRPWRGLAGLGEQAAQT